MRGSVFWLHLPAMHRKSRRDEQTKVFKHFHSISFHQLFPHSSLCTHTFNPKDISQPCTHMSNFKFTHPSGSIIFPPARRRAKDSPKVCYLETNNIFPLARTEKWPTKDPSVHRSWLPQKENSQKHIAKASRDKIGNMTDKICEGKLIEFERERESYNFLLMSWSAAV